jgi:hypothetical protein
LTAVRRQPDTGPQKEIAAMRRPILLIAALALTGTAAVAAPAPEVSWGKAGISFDDYRLDASRCLATAQNVDLRGTEPARVLARASRQIDAALPGSASGGMAPSTMSAPGDRAGDGVAANLELVGSAARVAHIVESARPGEQIDAARGILQSALDECLSSLGYHRFRLTDEQRERLRRLRSRTEARQHYLHSIASDPRVLAAQGL